MKFSKHVETCFVRANDDFDDKSTYIYCFLNKKKYWTKIPKNGHCEPLKSVQKKSRQLVSISIAPK